MPRWIDLSLRKRVCDKTVKHLFKDNNTLKPLKLNIFHDLLLDIVEVNTPLTALDIRSQRLYYQQHHYFLNISMDYIVSYYIMNYTQSLYLCYFNVILINNNLNNH